MTECITKDEVISLFEKWSDGYTYIEIPVQDAIRQVSAIQPSDVRPNTDGNWIPVTNGRGGHECSRCHEYAPSYQSGNEYLSRFCTSCGCYMGEE